MNKLQNKSERQSEIKPLQNKKKNNENCQKKKCSHIYFTFMLLILLRDGHLMSQKKKLYAQLLAIETEKTLKNIIKLTGSYSLTTNKLIKVIKSRNKSNYKFTKSFAVHVHSLNGIFCSSATQLSSLTVD